MLGTLIFVLICCIMAVQYMRGQSEAIGNWSYLFSNLQYDPETFYKHLHQLIQARGIPDVSTRTRHFKEGGMLSHHRVYFEVQRKDFTFHVCAAPWGSGFFFSWWLREKLSSMDELLIMIPFVGPPIVRARQHKAYYKLDTDVMFRKSVHQCILEAIDQITEAKGVRGLTELDRKPDLKSLVK